jgi:hypothetical protein
MTKVSTGCPPFEDREGWGSLFRGDAQREVRQCVASPHLDARAHTNIRADGKGMLSALSDAPAARSRLVLLRTKN